MDLLIVTGMSGAGKTNAMAALEDIGYFCVDNVPPAIISKFLSLPDETDGEISKIAIVVDIRSQKLFSGLLKSIGDFNAQNVSLKILFLDCEPDILATRYKETRRKHPLISGGQTDLFAAIAEEKMQLNALRERADYLIDTSHTNANQLKSRIKEIFKGGGASPFLITCQSFGFKYGIPTDSDLVFDVRFLDNPFYIEDLKALTGKDKPVLDYVLSFKEALIFADKLYDMFDFLLPQYEKEGKSQLVISVGCTGGKHRSVVFAELLAGYFSSKGMSSGVFHRDIKR